jgi:hypothetical protein
MNPTVRKTRLFLPLVFFLFSLFGCTKEPDYLYKVTSLGLNNVDYSGVSPVIATGGTIPAKAYCIQLSYTTEITGSTSGRDPNESGYALYTKITRFTISSTSDFDEQHPAGASLNAYFYYSAYGPAVGATDSIPYALSADLVLASYRSDISVNSWQDSSYLVLMQPPTQGFPGPRTFIVNVAFADSTQLTDSVSVNLY